MNKRAWFLIFTLCVIFTTTENCLAKTIMDETITVPALSYYYCRFTTNDVVTLNIDLKADIIAVDVIIMNEKNYNLWVSGEQAFMEFYRPNILEGEYDVQLDKADTYYLLLVNENLLFSSLVKIKVTTQTILDSAVSIILFIIGGVFFLLVIIKISTQSRKRNIQYSPIITMPNTQPATKPVVIKICKHCGIQLENDAIFCPNCGTKVEL